MLISPQREKEKEQWELQFGIRSLLFFKWYGTPCNINMYIDVTESDYYLGFKGLKSVIFPQRHLLISSKELKKENGFKVHNPKTGS